ncbi:MAG TPA: GNAT family N-acetyltransferase [Thermoplasmata archaeon]|nr:GNAT family N-acetyltransferase [Thermoplasmata archaeon]
MPDSPKDPTVEVRPVREGEWESYRDLRLEALRTDPLAFGSTLARERDFSPEMWRERISRGVAEQAALTFVAVDSTGRFVGTAAVATLEGDLHLFAMWVDPERRRTGVGGKLLDAALGWVRSSHPGSAVVLDVNPRQGTAVQLYESRGFRRTGKFSSLGHTPGEQVMEMIRAPDQGSRNPA